jgi:hypothetical protein
MKLGALLEAHWPGAKQVFSRLGSQVALAFLDAYPTPESAARLGQARPAGLLPAALLPRRPQPWRAARAAAVGASGTGRSCSRGARRAGGRPGPTAAHPAGHHRRTRSSTGGRAVGACQGRAAGPATTHRRGQPGPGRGRGRPDPGSRQHRRARHGRVRRRTSFAGNSRHSSPWAAKVYADARRRGKHHPHAVRILARAWLRVIWACWHNDTIYDPARHGAERRLAART